jgi:transmembrane sensor
MTGGANATRDDAATLDRLREVAAEWIVSLTGDDEAERLRALSAFDAWKRADPRHAAAAAHMEHLIGDVRALRRSGAYDARAARTALDAPRVRSRRSGPAKRAQAALAIALLVAVCGGMALPSLSPRYLLADLRTSSDGWETRVLSDGSRITLRGTSAVNIRFDDTHRTIELVRGEILVEVAKDRARPFVVDTADGGIRALGTRFTVDREAQGTELTMLESRVTVWSGAAPPASGATLVSAGERVHFTASGVGRVEPVDARGVSDAWQFHQLVVDRLALPDVLDQLSRHRPGRIAYDRAQLEAIRVSAVLPLDDTDRALQLLAARFPQLRVRTLTPYFVLVDAPDR